MSLSKDTIRDWINDGLRNDKKWLIVVCDTFSYEDYPVFVTEVEEFDEKFTYYNGNNMQRIMEVYDLEGDIESQIDERRAWSLPSLTTKTSIKKITANPLLDWVEKKGA